MPRKRKEEVTIEPGKGLNLDPELIKQLVPGTLNQALALHHLNLQSTLKRVAASHFGIVLDLVLRDTSALEACISALAPRRTYVIGVGCPLDVLEERERSRPDRGEGMARSQFGHPAYSRPYSMRLDTSTCSPEEGAQRIRSFINAQTE